MLVLLISSSCTRRWDPPGSFVNDGWTISMKPVSMGQMTHIHMTGKFLTEPENKVHDHLSVLGTHSTSGNTSFEYLHCS